MVRQDGALAQPLRKVMRHALRQPPRVDENQGRAMRENGLGEPVVNLRPHFIAGHRSQLVFGNFNRQIQLSLMPAIDN